MGTRGNLELTRHTLLRASQVAYVANTDNFTPRAVELSRHDTSRFTAFAMYYV